MAINQSSSEGWNEYVRELASIQRISTPPLSCAYDGRKQLKLKDQDGGYENGEEISDLEVEIGEEEFKKTSKKEQAFKSIQTSTTVSSISTSSNPSYPPPHSVDLITFSYSLTMIPDWF